MAISRAEVEKVSLLARLRLSDDELDRMTSQLGEILDYVDLLSELDTDASRADGPRVGNRQCIARRRRPSKLGAGVGLGQRPAPRRRCYLVPAVLGE